MNCIILAAGYATRLYPLTKNTAKPLLPVSGRPILEHIIAKVEKIDGIEHIYIVTNNKFYEDFVTWQGQYNSKRTISVLNDGTLSNDDRLGAIADMQFVLEKEDLLNDDLMVLGGDNLFDFELTCFYDYFQMVGADCITAHVITNKEVLSGSGVIEVDEDGKVNSFEEKPDCPRSNLAVPPFYIYKKETLPLITEYLKEGNNPDAPGNFIPWLIEKKPVYVFQFEGRRYDIGTLESYKLVQDLFSKKLK